MQEFENFLKFRAIMEKGVVNTLFFKYNTLILNSQEIRNFVIDKEFCDLFLFNINSDKFLDEEELYLIKKMEDSNKFVIFLKDEKIEEFTNLLE